MTAFVDVVAGKSLRTGVSGLLQAAGVERMRPNMVLMGFPLEEDSAHVDSGDDIAAVLGRAPARQRRVLGAIQASDGDNHPGSALQEFYRESSHGAPPSEFVGIVSDTLLLGMTVGIMRHFGSFQVPMPGSDAVVDIWPGWTAQKNGHHSFARTVIRLLDVAAALCAKWGSRSVFRVVSIAKSAGAVSAETAAMRRVLCELGITKAAVMVVAPDAHASEACGSIQEAHEAEACPSPHGRSARKVAQTARMMNRLMRVHSAASTLVISTLPQLPEWSRVAYDNAWWLTNVNLFSRRLGVPILLLREPALPRLGSLEEA